MRKPLAFLNWNILCSDGCLSR